MLYYYIGARFERHCFSERRFDLAGDAEVVEYRRGVLVEFHDVARAGGYEVDVFLYLPEDIGVVDVDIFKGGAEYVAQHAHDSVFFFKHQFGCCGALRFLAGVLEGLHECFQLVVEFCHALAFGRCADYHAVVARLDAFHKLVEARFFLRRFDFLRYRYFVAEGCEDEVASCEGDVGGEARAFRRYRLFHYLHQQFFAGCEEVGHGAVFVDFGQKFHLRQPRLVLAVCQQLGYKFLVGGEMRAEIEVMEECILFISHVNEGGIQPRHQFFDLCQVDVADSIGDVARFFLKRHKPTVLQKGDRYLRCLYVYD